MTNVKPGDNLQAAINAGDVKLLAGLHLAAGLTVPNGRIIANETGAILRGAMFNLKGTQGVRFPDGLEMDGAGARTAMILENAKGIQIDGLFCHNYGEGLYVNRLDDSWVRGARFENVGGQASNTAIFGDEPRRCDLSGNLFKNCGEGIHFFFKLFQFGNKKTDPSIRNDVTINFNQFIDVRRHPIELQEGVRGLKVRGNFITWTTNAVKSIIGISAALGGDPSSPGPDAWEIEIWENVIDGARLPVSDTSQFMGIECMGDTFNAHHNDINNMGQPFAVTFNSKNLRIADNNVRGTVRPPQSWWKDSQGIIVADPPQDHYVPVIDTGNHWSTDPMPGPPDSGGGGDTTTMQLTVIGKSGADGGGAFDFGWKQLPALTKRVKVFGAATGDPANQNNDKTTHAGPPAAWDTTGDGSGSSDGWHPGWHFDFTAIALDASGKELARSPVVNMQSHGNPATEPWPPTTTPPPPRGVIVSTDVEIDGAGKVLSSKSTTKPRTAPQ